MTEQKVKQMILQGLNGLMLDSRAIARKLSQKSNTLKTSDCGELEVDLTDLTSDPAFCAAVVACYEAHIAAGGTDPEFLAELVNGLSEPIVINKVLEIVNNALATSPNPLLSNLCAYINDCIDNNLLVVSADAGNLIKTGTDGGALLVEADLANAIDNLETLTKLEWYEVGTDAGLDYTDEDGASNKIKLSHTETIGHTMNVPYTITHGLNSTRISVVAYDIATGGEINIEVINRTLNTVDVISTVSDNMEIVVKK